MRRKIHFPKEDTRSWLSLGLRGCVIGIGIDSGLVAHLHLHWVMESVSDLGYGHEDIPCMTYDIHVDIFTWMCMGWFDHCMST